MRNLVSTYVEQFRQDRQKQIRLAAILAALAVVVAGVVFWQLHNTGVAMSNEVYCGQEEHVHDESCYETILVCGQDESEGHVHDDSCYETVETLICTDDSEDHVHTADCYEATQELICGLEETSGHTHTEDCYETVLVCDIPEHTHTIECMIDETADVETANDWEATLPEELSGVWADDMVAVAESQVGYTESTANFQLAEDGETRQGYTRYGAWYGNEYGDWDAMFASFCLNYAGVPEEDFPEASGSYAWITELEDLDLYVPGDDFTALPGDLVFFDTDGDGEADSVGIVKEIQEDADFVVDEETGETVTTTVVTVIEGNSEDAVQENEYQYDDAAIIGYGILPEQTTAESVVLADFDESVVDEDYDDGVLTGEKNFLYEDDDLVLKVNVDGSVEIPESAVKAYNTEHEDMEETAAPSWEDITMEAVMVTENNEAYEQMLSYAEEQDGELYQLFDVDLMFFYGENEVDVSDCDITVDAAPTQTLLEAAAPEQVEDALVELGVTVAMLEVQEENIVELDSANVTSENPEDAALSADISGNDFGIMLLADADPHFTVQFYANIEQILTQETSGDESLTVIETHTNSGAVLPTNNSGGTANTSVVELHPVAGSSDQYYLDYEIVLTEMYKEEGYEFIDEPDLQHMNKLQKNGDYVLYEIWKLTGNDPTSTNRNDWTIYTYEDGMDFTNNPDETSKILIEEGDVFRFVYNISESDATVDANFYDYNITDGKVYASASTSGSEWSGSGTRYAYTYLQGINSSANYAEGVTNSRLGFGNSNTGSGVQDDTWSNSGFANRLNRSNSYGINGCTFSLVDHLDSNGNIVYSSGVNAPNLFSDGSAVGKTTLENGSLTYLREGDTYTLTTATLPTGATTNGLDTFTGRDEYADGVSFGKTIYSNNFWPVDSITSENYPGTTDLQFGEINGYNAGDPTYFGNGSATGKFPPSDDSVDHNSYFGMNFAIDFDLTADYVGPLEYFFFGDDDMWVFLDGELVLDIGGVHSSVGEHVDLWDYITKGTAGTHTLSIFYTERGASGSSCYIRYTLPSTSSATIVNDAGNLVVEKNVEGEAGDTNKDFSFQLSLTDSTGSPLTNVYTYEIYEDNGFPVGSGQISTGSLDFTLKDGYYIVVFNLPVDALATVTETSEDGYSTTYEVSVLDEDGNPITGIETTSGGGTSANGTIYNGSITRIVFTNTAGTELPNAGGTGIWSYTVIGAFLVGGAATALIYRRRRAVRS